MRVKQDDLCSHCATLHIRFQAIRTQLVTSPAKESHHTHWVRLNFVKPGRVKLAMGHLLHGKSAPWNCALQTRVPPGILGLVHQDLSTLLSHVAQRMLYWVEHSCWPSLFHCSPPSFDPVCNTLCHYCLLARHAILHGFYDTHNAGYMVLGLGWI